MISTNKAIAGVVFVIMIWGFFSVNMMTGDTLKERFYSEKINLLEEKVNFLKETNEKLNTIIESLPLASPTDTVVISSSFGWRNNPRGFHSGIDISAGPWENVYATGGGKVIAAGWYNDKIGNCVVIKHENGYTSSYGHLSKILVKWGDMVYRGDTIGRPGDTGRSYGYHLHYEIRKNRTPLNPINFLII